MNANLTKTQNFRGGVRSSNIELFRILSMLMIVAHHYVVNSGLLDCIEKQSQLGVKDYFLLLFGWGGKTGIDCFVLITGCAAFFAWQSTIFGRHKFLTKKNRKTP